jgi:hypothetical protein
MLEVGVALLIELLRALITRAKTPSLAIVIKVPMPSASQYLNPHISAESFNARIS